MGNRLDHANGVLELEHPMPAQDGSREAHAHCRVDRQQPAQSILSAWAAANVGDSAGLGLEHIEHTPTVCTAAKSHPAAPPRLLVVPTDRPQSSFPLVTVEPVHKAPASAPGARSKASPKRSLLVPKSAKRHRPSPYAAPPAPASATSTVNVSEVSEQAAAATGIQGDTADPPQPIRAVPKSVPKIRGSVSLFILR